MQFEKITDMCLIREKFETFQNLTYLTGKPNISRFHV